MAKSRRNHVISRRKFREFVAAHPEHAGVMKKLLGWYREAERADWPNFAAVRRSFNHADQVGEYVVFNVGGNKVRLVTMIFYNTKPRRIYILHVLTHSEYDRGDWKA
jgi:mRNA interferase HigB